MDYKEIKIRETGRRMFWKFMLDSQLPLFGQDVRWSYHIDVERKVVTVKYNSMTKKLPIDA